MVPLSIYVLFDPKEVLLTLVVSFTKPNIAVFVFDCEKLINGVNAISNNNTLSMVIFYRGAAN